MPRLNTAVRLGIVALASVTWFAACSDDTKPTEVGTFGERASVSAGTSSSDWQQCANNGRDTTPCEWISSVLNVGKAKYFEGENIPFRFAVHIVDMQGKKQVAPDPNVARRVTFTYGFTKATNGNYDFIGKFNQTEKFRANLCSADYAPVAGIYCASSTRTLLSPYVSTTGTGQASPLYDSPDGQKHSVITIDSTKFLANVPATQRPALSAALKNYLTKGGKLEIDVFGGRAISVDTVKYNIGGDDITATMTVRFYANQKDVLIAFGAHFARTQDWDDIGWKGGAGQSGSPFHIKVDSIDGTGVGALGNNVAGGVVLLEPNIYIDKTVSSDTVSAGDSLSWTITLTNGGDGAASDAQIVDPLPTIAGYTYGVTSTPSGVCSITLGTLTCGPTSVAANGGTLTAVVTATWVGPVNALTTCSTFRNVATGKATGLSDVKDSVDLTVLCPNLSVAKVAAAASVVAGDSIGFAITTRNAGPGTAKTVTLTDTLPGGTGISWAIKPTYAGPGSCSITGSSPQVLGCAFGDIAAGDSAKVFIKSATTSGSCQEYDNTAIAKAVNDGPETASDTITVTCPNIGLTKVADADTVTAGDSIGFVLTVSNGTGAGDAKNVALLDTLPGGTGISWVFSPSPYAGTGTCTITGTPQVLSCSFGTLGGGTSASVHVKSGTTGGSCKVYTNIAKATVGNDGAKLDTATTTVSCPDLRITKTADADSVSARDTIGFAITVSNGSAAGTGDARGVTLTDTLPSGTGISWFISPAYSGAGTCAITGTAPNQILGCSFGTLGPGTSATVYVKSATTTGSCKTYTNIAAALATNDGTVKDTATTKVQCPLLSIVKTAVSSTVAPGDSAIFTITVADTGKGKAYDVVLTDTLPNTGLVWGERVDKTECTISTITGPKQLLACNVGTLNPGGSFSVQVSAKVPASYVLNPPSPAGTAIEIDGNLRDGAAAGADWNSLPDSTFSCGSTKKGCDIDSTSGTHDNSFGQGTKEDTPVPSVVTGSIPNNKSDLLRFYLASQRFDTTNYLYLAWERVQAPNGTTNMDFELNQDTVLSANGVTPRRTAGDILIAYDLAKGGTVPVLSFHRWVTSVSAGSLTPAQACEASNAFPCWGKGDTLSTDPTKDVRGAINTDTTTDTAWDPDKVLDPLTFGEASINLQKSGIFQSGVCVSFGKAYLKSRSSDAFTSEIKDFIAPIPVNVTNCSPKNIDNRAWAAAYGVTAISDTGRISVSAPTASSLRLAPASLRRTSSTSSGATHGVVSMMVASAVEERAEATVRVRPELRVVSAARIDAPVPGIVPSVVSAALALETSLTPVGFPRHGAVRGRSSPPRAAAAPPATAWRRMT